MRGRRDLWWLVTVSAFFTVLAFLVYPLVTVLLTSFSGEEKRFVLAENYQRFFTHRYYYSSIINSLYLSTLATIGALALGTSLAFAVARYPLPGKAFLRTAANLSLLSPPFIGAYSWVVLFGRMGLVNRVLGVFGWSLPSIYGWRGILLVFIVQYFPFVFLLVSAAIRSVDQSIEDAALSLGSPPRRTLCTAILPILAPSLTAGGLLVFMGTMADFGTPMIIGEGLRTLPTLMYGEFMNELGGNPAMASTLGSLLILVNTAGPDGAAVLCLPQGVQRGLHPAAARAAHGQEQDAPSQRFRLRGRGGGADPLAHHHHLLVHAHQGPGDVRGVQSA